MSVTVADLLRRARDVDAQLADLAVQRRRLAERAADNRALLRQLIVAGYATPAERGEALAIFPGLIKEPRRFGADQVSAAEVRAERRASS